jgi:hypothetical protein
MNFISGDTCLADAIRQLTNYDLNVTADSVLQSVSVDVDTVIGGGQGTGLLTAATNFLTSEKANTATATLPPAFPGKIIQIISNSLYRTILYPSLGNDIGYGVDVPGTIFPRSYNTLIAVSDVLWMPRKGQGQIDLEPWDMTDPSDYILNHNLGSDTTKITRIQVAVFRNSQANLNPTDLMGGANLDSMDDTTFTFTPLDGDLFNTSNYDGTANNRGIINLTYNI